ncbi:hypothetical protein SEA_SUIGENERIS_73 [Mycobacterium phage Suigeneris]|uniref:Uncharacterized protein n=1 Tax=Mycobacterium phage Suigeneris TaxID=2776881 RepID=A0A7M1CMZ3_9CAUD|nr:hypothetical protein SEA_SUIGENERIS_73 [Mycobacterium phage Suigeneris]
MDRLATPDPTTTTGPTSAADLRRRRDEAIDALTEEAKAYGLDPDNQLGFSHSSELVERHRITLPVGATGDNVAVARLHAEAYARARGFDLSAGSLGVISRLGKVGDEYLGVAFDVVVGKGDIAMDQRVPGVLDRWTWSGGALQWWRKVLGNGDGRQGRVLARLDDLDRGRRVVPGPWRGADALNGLGLDQASQTGHPTVADDRRPPWMKHDSEGE